MLKAEEKGKWKLSTEALWLLNVLPPENGLGLCFCFALFCFLLFCVFQYFINKHKTKESKDIFNEEYVYLMVFRRTLHKTALRDGSMLCAPRRVPPRSPANTLLFGALQIRSSPIWRLQTLQFVWEFWFLVLNILESQENKCMKIYPLFAKSERGNSCAKLASHENTP